MISPEWPRELGKLREEVEKCGKADQDSGKVESAYMSPTCNKREGRPCSWSSPDRRARFLGDCTNNEQPLGLILAKAIYTAYYIMCD
jgi:hypothetical protein